jgi:hypothetical protein
MGNEDMSRLLLAVVRHRIVEPESDPGLDRLIALVGGDPTKDEMRQAVANAVTDGYIHDPVRLPAGALQCHWHLELTPRASKRLDCCGSQTRFQ